MEQLILQFVERKHEEIVEYWFNDIQRFKNLAIEHVPEPVFQQTNRDFVYLILAYIQNDEDPSFNRLREFVKRLIHQGWPLGYFIQGLQSFRQVILNYLFGDKVPLDCKSAMQVIDQVGKWINPIILALVNEYSGTWENQFSMQKLALKELSAPVIPIFDRICVMPIIGTIDSERTQIIMENLLEGVIKHRSEVVLIDITGVPVVDSMVAHHITQSAQAVRLIGARCILVGIRPEIAQTIVKLGIDLRQFMTQSTLKKGIQMALELTNQKITNLH